MSSLEQDEQTKKDTYFITHSVAEALVPANYDLSIEELSDSERIPLDDSSSSLLPWVKQRDVLFLDEDVHVLVALKTPLQEEDTVKAFIQRLQIAVELCATGLSPNTKPGEPRPHQVKDVLSEATAGGEYEPIIIVRKDEDAGNEAFLLILWKINLPLNRPHVKLHKLSIYLSPTVSLKALEQPKKAEIGSRLLPSMVPQPINLFQPFEFDPRFDGQQPYLSASRITKVAPAAPAARDNTQRLKTVPKRLFRAGPALFWRIRFSKTTAPPKTNAMYATIELEVPELCQYDVSVRDIDLHLIRGEVEGLGPTLPEALKPGDQFTVLYKMAAPSDFSKGTSSVYQLDIVIKAVARLSQQCTPSLNIKWTTNADFTFDQKLKPGITAESARTSMDQQRAIGPDSLPFSKDGNLEKPVTPLGPTGVFVTITGPDKILVGKAFLWEVFIVNRSDVLQSLAIFPISRPSVSQERRPFPPSITPLQITDGAARGERVGNSNDVYDMPISWFFEPGELTCMSSNAMPGPLPPATCGTTELKFTAAVPGVLHIEAIRVVDLTTRLTWDITDLPDIVAELEE